MNWSKEVPTKEGYYWRLSNNRITPVYIFEEDGYMAIEFMGLRCPYNLLGVTRLEESYWLPIEVPEAPEGVVWLT